MQELVNTQTKGLSTLDLYALFERELDASEKTRATYTRSLRQWRNYLEAQGATETEATRETVLAYRDSLQEAGKSAATVNAYLTAVRALYAWLEARRVYPNVAAGIKGQRRNPNSPKDALTREQAARLLDKQPETLQQKRDYALINLLLRRGLRTVEAARANIGDVRQVNGQAVLYVQGKGYADKGDFIVLNEACLLPLYAYLEARGDKDPNAPLFAGIGNRNQGGRMSTRTISRIVKEAMQAEGMASANLTAHSLRHTAVTFALLGGASVQEAQAMARHRNISTTLIYAHNLDRMEAGAEHALDAYLQPVTSEYKTEYKPNTL